MTTPQMLIVEIHVMPSSSRVGFFFDAAGRLKCRLSSPPEKGLANRELIELVARALGVSKNAVQIVSGLTARKKRLQLTGVSNYTHFLKLVGLEQPDTQLTLM